MNKRTRQWLAAALLAAVVILLVLLISAYMIRTGRHINPDSLRSEPGQPTFAILG